MMKPRLLLSTLIGSLAASAHAGEPCSAASDSTFKPLVELYTSEGCSSCPPADRWLSTQITRTDVNVLAFHVDYWDDIGWVDRFASPAYSQRQRQRVSASGGNSVYTPQVMVGANATVSWQSPSTYNKAVDANTPPERPSLMLELKRGESGAQAIVSAAAATVEADPQLWLAEYLDAQTSDVRAGENRGTTLHHDRVVKKLWGPWPLRGGSLSKTQSIDVPEGPWGLVAFVQDDRGNTLQSLGLPANACGKISAAAF